MAALLRAKTGIRQSIVGAFVTMLLGAACTGENDGPVPGFETATPGGSPTATATATATPTSFLTPTPIPIPAKEKSGDRARQPVKTPGPVDAKPYRVHTGDGDCLNVRPQPGTRFPTDPRTCVPEDFLLWLYGDPVAVDGFTWRYALGEGWVAMQYVRPDPASADLLGDRAPEVVVVAVTDTVETFFARVTPGGKVDRLESVNGSYNISFTQGEGSVPAYAATMVYENATRKAIFTNLETGSETTVPEVDFLGWSSRGTALLYTGSRFIAYSPGNGRRVDLGQVPSDFSGYAWTPDGKAILAVGTLSSIYEYPLDGSGPRTVLGRSTERQYLGELSISPNGKQAMSSPYLGALQVISLTNGAIREFERAPQQAALGGRCGGASGRLSVWLDDETIVWHESYAQKGFNGITIGHLDTGERDLVPFFTLQDITRVDARTIMFSTNEYFEGAGGQEYFAVTWILDIESGEARPLTYGTTAGWRGV